jgi:hypothetical protein
MLGGSPIMVAVPPMFDMMHSLRWKVRAQGKLKHMSSLQVEMMTGVPDDIVGCKKKEFVSQTRSLHQCWSSGATKWVGIVTMGTCVLDAKHLSQAFSGAIATDAYQPAWVVESPMCI